MEAPHQKPVRILILAMPETSPGVVYSVYEVLASVGTVWTELTGQPEPGRGIEVLIVAETDKPITTTIGFPLLPHATFAQAGQGDVIIVPDLAIAPTDDPTARWPAARRWLAGQAAGGACMTSICSGSVLLAATGLLDGEDATTHWAFAGLFERCFPAVRLRAERVLCPAGPSHMVVTSGGAAAWSDLVLYLIARFTGRTRAIHAAKIFLLGDHSEGQLPFAAMIRPHHHEDRIIDRCQRFIADNYTRANPVELMIAQSGLAPRTFKRRFKAATGYAPIDYVQVLRIEEAKHLLETSELAINAVATEVGYEDAAFFRRLFHRHAGVTPSRYRQRFQILAARP